MINSNLENIKGIPHYDFEDKSWYKQAKIGSCFTEIVEGIVDFCFDIDKELEMDNCCRVLEEAGLNPFTIINKRCQKISIRVVIEDYIKTYPER